MEDVLDLYQEPYDPKCPKVCFDETSKQLVAETRSPLPPKPGQPERYDYEYQRNGTRNLFLFCEPQRGWRHVEVTEQRTIDSYHTIVHKHLIPHLGNPSASQADARTPGKNVR